MINKKGAILAILMTIGIAAAAGYQLTVTPLSQDIPIGTSKDYTITFDTTGTCTGTASNPCGILTWDTSDPLLVASINSATPGQTGHIDIISWTPGTQTFTLHTTPQSGIKLGDKDITVDFSLSSAPAIVKASVTAGVNPVPELATGILVSAGLIGLIGLVRYKKI